MSVTQMPGNHGQRVGNRLLGSLRKEAFATLSAHLETVRLEPREVLYASGQPIEQVYFPHSGIVCLLGGNKAANRALVQVAGSASRISIQRLRAPLAESTLLPGPLGRDSADSGFSPAGRSDGSARCAVRLEEG